MGDGRAGLWHASFALVCNAVLVSVSTGPEFNPVNRALIAWISSLLPLSLVSLQNGSPLSCRRNSQAVTFEEFREHMCNMGGLEAAPTIGATLPYSPTTTGRHHGDFCKDNTVLQLDTSFSLEGACRTTSLS